MHKVDNLNTFYLGKKYQEMPSATEEYVLFPSKNLTTHAFCVGMTGSGKTGLCLTLLEEAALDGIPAILVDPKGDIANLLLQFPNLHPADFEPFVTEDGTASRQEKARTEAEKWQQGLRAWGIEKDRILALTERVQFELYTPGSNLAKPLAMTQIFSLPPKEILQNPELLQESVSASVLALLGLLGIEGEVYQSREFILLSNLLGFAWVKGESLDMANLVMRIQKPPFAQLGVMPLETFYPAKERFALAMKLNTLLASPKFHTWLQGDALDVHQLLYTKEGKAKISILSLAHLNDQERMFFVTLLFNQMVSFMRTQNGTSSLRALLYMDEIYGYLPPLENPSSKRPLLTLLKQARAFGIGLVLATQNPVDLDYKALSNCGTWWIGRLQTERDRARLLDGMDFALQAGGQALTKERLNDLIARLPQRVFVQHSVHQSSPLLLQTRFCMSYLAGPLSREQLSLLSQALQTGQIASSPYAQAFSSEHTASLGTSFGETQSLANAYLQAQAPTASMYTSFVTEKDVQTTPWASSFAFDASASASLPPQLPHDLPFAYLPPLNKNKQPHYKPYLYGHFQVYYKDSKAKWQSVQKVTRLVPMQDGVLALDFEKLLSLSLPPNQLHTEAWSKGTYAPLPALAQKASQYKEWQKELTERVYREQELSLWYAPLLKLYSQEGETESAFRIRLEQMARETMDEEMDVLKEKYEKKLFALDEKIRKAEQALEREKSQAKQQTLDTAISVGASIFGVLLGGGKRSVGSGLARAGRSATRVSRQNSDVARSKETYAHYLSQREALEQEMLEEVALLREKLEEKYFVYETVKLKPQKKDVVPELVLLVFGE